MRARSQQYAETIFGLVDFIRKQEGIAEKDKKRYGALCHRFPLIIRENGLAAAFGFLAAKGATSPKSPEILLLGHYATVLGLQNREALLNGTIHADLLEYRHMTRKALAAAEWFKRYAEAVLKVDPTGADTTVEENNNG